MPQIYLREYQHDAIIALGIEDREEKRQFIFDCVAVGIDYHDALVAIGLEGHEERRQFIDDCIAAGIKKETRKRKK